ncbi:MAG TPA: HAD family phosphatase [Sphingomicrobium sp.]|nr:HAD family phosphatase [Sphingomicrobium sp.]
MRFQAIIFDFDGVLLESEFQGNRDLAALLTDLGHETRVEDAFKHYAGLSGRQFIDAIENRIGARLPAEFYTRRNEQSVRALREGIEAVVGAVEFVRSLPPELPKAVASSSSTHWISTHLDHLGLSEAFGEHVFSGPEHVERGKPAPDIYLFAARALGVDIARSVILEDSEVGATGALASGASVIGVAAGRHCFDNHAQRLRDLGVQQVAHSFDEVARLLDLRQPRR